MERPLGDFFNIADTNRETLPPGKGITVVTREEDTLKKWVELMSDISTDPFMGNKSPGQAVPLGDLEINDAVFKDLSAGLSFIQQDGTYNIDVIMQLNPGEERSGGMPFAHPHGRLSRPASRVKIDFAKTKQLLEQTPSCSDFNFELDRNQHGEQLKITHKHPGKEEDHGMEWYLQGINRQPQVVHLGGVVGMIGGGRMNNGTSDFALYTRSENPATFKSAYAKIGFLAEQIINLVYTQNDLEAPEKEFVIKPPARTEQMVKRLGDAVEAQSKMHEMVGLSNDNGHLAKEVMSKVEVIEKPTDTFNDVGGCDEAKKELSKIPLYFQQKDVFDGWGSKMAGGILLHGEKGGGKTLLARATANEAGVPFFSVKISDIIDALVGKSEKSVRVLFEEAAKRAPCLMFFDEVDAIAGRRDYASEFTLRLVAELLANLDGFNKRPEQVVFMAATNRLESIDPPFLRPGRFDKIIEVPMPDDNARVDILDIKMRQAIQRARGRQIFVPDFDKMAIAKKTPGFSGADIQEVIRRAVEEKATYEALTKEVPGPIDVPFVLPLIESYETIRVAKNKAGSWFNKDVRYKGG